MSLLITILLFALLVAVLAFLDLVVEVLAYRRRARMCSEIAREARRDYEAFEALETLRMGKYGCHTCGAVGDERCSYSRHCEAQAIARSA